MASEIPAYPLPHCLPSWPRIAEALASADSQQSPSLAVATMICTVRELDSATRAQAISLLRNMPALEAAASAFPDFQSRIFPAICRLARSVPEAFAPECTGIPMLEQDKGNTVSLTRRQCASLLACAFFDILRPMGDVAPAFTKPGVPVGDLRFVQLFNSHARVANERAKCLVAYFAYWADIAADSPLWDEVVEFARISTPARPVAFWREGCETMDFANVDVVVDSKQLMEDFPDHNVMVDFANRDLMIGEVIPSATQEEVLFSVRSELFLTLLFCERLLDHEAVVVRGAQSYCTYSGYSMRFTFEAPRTFEASDAVAEVLAIDAHVNHGRSQFAEMHLVRDLNKALNGFAGCENDIISTGLWGCGIFGGCPPLKFLQQLMAACVAGKSLRFSTFGDDELCSELNAMIARIKSAGISVSQLFAIISVNSPTFLRKGAFEQHLHRELARANGEDVSDMPCDKLQISEKELAAADLIARAEELEEVGNYNDAVKLYRQAERLRES
eukprot:m.293459 g.293459  ORF g.293459 m.293459 type:complete len:503 (-) comp12804_c0_seq1:119-1627(-)